MKQKARKRESQQLRVETKAKKAKARAIRKEIHAKQKASRKKNKVADEKRHKVVININKHKKILNHLGRISAKLADQKAHMDATAPLASKESDYKQKKAAAIKTHVDAVGIQKAAMKRAAELAKEAAAAQLVVKKDVLIAKRDKALERKAEASSKKADHAFKLNQMFNKKHAATTVLHARWTKKSEDAAKKVTLSKEVAVNAMETAQCVIKDKRSGCPKWKKTNHCHTKKWKAWMVTHCTESCGFSCSDLHELAMGIVKVASKKKAKRDRSARKKACPKYNKIVQNYAKYADKYASFSTQFEQSCQMRREKDACAKKKRYAALSVKYEDKHVEYKKRAVDLGCYTHKSQWKKAKKAKKAAKKGKKAKKAKKGKKAAKKKAQKKAKKKEEEFDY